MMTTSEARNMTPEQASEVLGDIFSLCAKLLHDRDENGSVTVEDLCELRDTINLVRAALAGGAGYKAFGGRVRRG